MKYKYTLGLDPSGAFNEGKGTTGWCLLNNDTKQVMEIGSLRATNYDSACDYWNAHLALIEKMCKDYESVAISVEGYVLYQQQARSQINSSFETVQLIGIIKYYCWAWQLRYATRLASQAKARWSNDILKHKGYIISVGRSIVLTDPKGINTRSLCDHELDALRHALHYAYFENE